MRQGLGIEPSRMLIWVLMNSVAESVRIGKLTTQKSVARRCTMIVSRYICMEGFKPADEAEGNCIVKLCENSGLPQCCRVMEELGLGNHSETHEDPQTADGDAQQHDGAKATCNLDALIPAHLEGAVTWARSTSGNNGGVHFLTLESGCAVVIKPAVDTHDLVALKLGIAVGAPVVPSRPVLRSDPLFESTLRGIKRGAHLKYTKQVQEGKEAGLQGYNEVDEATIDSWASQAVDMFKESVGESKAIQLLEIAPGKDLYEMAKGFDFKSCTECATKFAEEQISKMHIPHPATRKHKFERFLKLASDCEGRNGASEQDDGKLAEVTKYFEDFLTSEPTKQQFAELSAFSSFVGESDGTPTVDSLFSNFHNVFVSPTQVTGIDIAVGSAGSHLHIKADGSGGQTLGDWESFFMKNMYDNGRCRQEPELKTIREYEGFMRSFTLKLMQPYFNNFVHQHAVSCQRAHGSVVDKELAESAAEQIGARISGYMMNILERADEALDTVEKDLAVFAQHGEMKDIMGWMRVRVRKLREAYSAARSRCGEGLEQATIEEDEDDDRDGESEHWAYGPTPDSRDEEPAAELKNDGDNDSDVIETQPTAEIREEPAAELKNEGDNDWDVIETQPTAEVREEIAEGAVSGTASTASQAEDASSQTEETVASSGLSVAFTESVYNSWKSIFGSM